mmetsp:Transcript_76565/g.234396  ORF Transcript_76565/g.234396 Transcript_76565/m.234396 type:complete len:250 (-) Transcript_76565:15-764(-)
MHELLVHCLNGAHCAGGSLAHESHIAVRAGLQVAYGLIILGAALATAAGVRRPRRHGVPVLSHDPLQRLPKGAPEARRRERTGNRRVAAGLREGLLLEEQHRAAHSQLHVQLGGQRSHRAPKHRPLAAAGVTVEDLRRLVGVPLAANQRPRPLKMRPPWPHVPPQLAKLVPPLDPTAPPHVDLHRTRFGVHLAHARRYPRLPLGAEIIDLRPDEQVGRRKLACRHDSQGLRRMKRLLRLGPEVARGAQG